MAQPWAFASASSCCLQLTAACIVARQGVASPVEISLGKSVSTFPLIALEKVCSHCPHGWLWRLKSHIVWTPHQVSSCSMLTRLKQECGADVMTEAPESAEDQEPQEAIRQVQARIRRIAERALWDRLAQDLAQQMAAGGSEAAHMVASLMAQVAEELAEVCTAAYALPPTAALPIQA